MSLSGPIKTPKFGDIVENGWASEENPTRRGYFVRAYTTTGRMNPGLHWQITDKHGKFWDLQPKVIADRLTVTPCQEGSASSDGGDGVPVRSLSVQATDKSDRAEGVAALQQAGEPISRENLEAELRETIGLYVREAVTRMFSEENATYRCARQIAGMLQPGYYLHRKLFSSPLPQQTALVEEGVEE